MSGQGLGGVGIALGMGSLREASQHVKSYVM